MKKLGVALIALVMLSFIGTSNLGNKENIAVARPTMGIWQNPAYQSALTWLQRNRAAETQFGVFAGHWRQFKPPSSNGQLGTDEETALADGKRLFSNWKVAGSGTWAQTAAGARDSVIVLAAQDWANHCDDNGECWVTFHHEPENDLGAAGSGMTAADYASMQRHVVSLWRSHAPEVKVVWTMMGFEGHQPLYPTLYPGDAYLDYIGHDPYINTTENPANLAAKIISRSQWFTANISTTKPYVIPEWGTDLNGGRGTVQHRADAIAGVTARIDEIGAAGVIELDHFNAREHYLSTADLSGADSAAFKALKDATEVTEPTPTPTSTPTETPTPTPTPTETPTPTSAPDQVVYAAGDICDDDWSRPGCRDTVDLIDDPSMTGLQTDADAVLLLGDNQYENGSLTQYNTYYQPRWGRVKPITKPAPGNHEYNADSTAAGYYTYFGAAAGDPARGYYSFDLEDWHVVAINSNCSRIGGCGVGSPQEMWLRADLAASTKPCTLAYWHHPLFTSGSNHSGFTTIRPLWQALYDHNAEVVLNGHNHQYERFAPQNPTGGLDTVRGVQEFVVGTGGKSHYGFGSPKPNSQVRNSTAFGVLRLVLKPDGYDWRFVPIAGQTFTDTGSQTCH